jgi:tetratricopeptide (TPR) repeat protein
MRTPSLLLPLLMLTLSVPLTLTAKTDPDLYSAAGGLYEDAISRAADGDFDGAVIQLKNLLQEEPRDLPARIALGRYQLRAGEPEAAEKELRRALTLGADRTQVLPVLGNALLMQRKYADLLDTITNSEPGITERFDLLTLRARALLELGRYKDARQQFDNARSAAPTRTEPLVGLALVGLAEGRMDDAMRDIDRALALDATDPEAWFQKGEIARAMRDPVTALDAYGQTLVQNPNHMRAHVSRAALLLERRDVKAALADVDYVLGRNPDDLQAAFLAGQCHLALGTRPRHATPSKRPAASSMRSRMTC